MSIKLNEVEEHTNSLKKWTQQELNILTQLCTHQHEEAVTQLSQLWLTFHTYWHKNMSKRRVASHFIHNETSPLLSPRHSLYRLRHILDRWLLSCL